MSNSINQIIMKVIAINLIVVRAFAFVVPVIAIYLRIIMINNELIGSICI